MNNESTKLGETSITQEMREQLEWDRLQNEALAAQRWRLEQEQQQAIARRDQQSGQSDSDTQSVTEFLPWNRLATSAFVLLAAFTAAAVAVFFWW